MKVFRHTPSEVQTGSRLSTAVEAERQINRWLARFAPLVREQTRWSADECREHLRLIQTLKSEEETLRETAEAHAEQVDGELLTTFRDAVHALPELETELRQRLAALVPGDPDGAVNLDKIRERLALVNARREVAETTGSRWQAGAELELRTSVPNWGAAGMQGMFCLGILGFTIPHAAIMIGGFARAFGPLALGLLLFYGIFWSVALGMGWSAVRAGSFEHITLRGYDLTVRWKFWSFEWSRVYRLSPDCEPGIDTFGVNAQNNAPKMLALSLTDADGKTVKLGAGRSERELQRLADQLREYLAVQQA